MIKKLIKPLKTFENKKLITNFFSLSVLQLSGFLLSLIILPYLVKVLGVENFGLVMYAQAVITYLTVFTDYGFNLSATRDISINTNNKEKLNKIFNSVIYTKLLLGFFSLLILFVIIIIIPKLRNDSYLFLYSFTIVIGQILFPIWFFQGIEQMKFITYLNVTAKLIYSVLIFVFIKTPDDFIYVNLFMGTGNIMAGIISVFFIIKKFNIIVKFPGFSSIKVELKNGYHILLSNFSINIYLNSNIIILGIFANSIVLGYYSIAEKVMMILRQILVVFSHVIYPHICKLATEGHNKLVNFYKKVFIPFLIFILMFSILLLVFAENIATFLTNNGTKEIGNLIILISFVPVIVCLNIPAYQTLLAYDQKKSYSIVYIAGSAVSLISNFVLSPILGAIGTCISIIITEMIITLGLFYVLEFRNRNISLFLYKSNS